MSDARLDEHTHPGGRTDRPKIIHAVCCQAISIPGEHRAWCGSMRSGGPKPGFLRIADRQRCVVCVDLVLTTRDHCPEGGSCAAKRGVA